MQRQKRLEQVWSSSIDTPKIFNDKTMYAQVFLSQAQEFVKDFRGFQANFISLSLDLTAL
jgi:hypothetical protein